MNFDRIKHRMGFILYPLSVLWLPRETFAFFGEVKSIKWAQSPWNLRYWIFPGGQSGLIKEENH